MMGCRQGGLKARCVESMVDDKYWVSCKGMGVSCKVGELQGE